MTEPISAPSQLPAPATAGPIAGAPVATTAPVYPNGKPMYNAAGVMLSDKSRLAAAILAWFLGVIGVHRFYTGKIGTGILQILTLGGLGVWTLIDFIMIVAGSFRDKAGRPLQTW